MLNFIIKPYYIFEIDRTIQNIVGPSEYGLFFSILNFTFLFNILLDFGINNFNSRNIARHTHLFQKHLSNIIILKFLLGILYLLLYCGLAIFIGYSSRQIFLLLFLAINQFFLSFILYFRSNLSGLHLFWLDSIISILDRLIVIIIVLYLIYFKENLRVEWFVYALTASYFITFIISAIITSIKARIVKLRFNKVFMLMILKKSYPYALLILLMRIYLHIDSVMLERMLDDGAKQAGIYAQSFTIFNAISMVPFLFAGILLPMLARMLKNKENPNKLIALNFKILMTPIIIFVVASVFYNVEIIENLFKYEAAISSKVYRILILNVIPVSLGYIFGTLLTANGSLKKLNTYATIGAILNIILNLILIPQYKTLGAAFASLTTQSLAVLLQIIYANKIFKFKLNTISIIKFVSFIFITIGIMYFSKNYFTENWIYNIIIASSLSFALSLLLKIIDIKSFFVILKKKI